jgi:hypothetical protein
VLGRPAESRQNGDDGKDIMTTETPRKRLMVPVCERPYALVTGELGGRLKFYGPTPLDDTPEGFREARTLRLDHVGGTWQLVELRNLGELDAIDGDNGVPDSPIEDKRNEFLKLVAEIHALRAARRGGGIREGILVEEALALAEELLA